MRPEGGDYLADERVDARRERDKQHQEHPEQEEPNWFALTGAPRPGDEVIPLHTRNNRRTATLRELEEHPENFEGLEPADKFSDEEAEAVSDEAVASAEAVAAAQEADSDDSEEDEEEAEDREEDEDSDEDKS